ncbi:hypothetical protein QJQ45_027353 [Haematococcus lacustris]|nr:hypothetical protein QJQ45_027353 [Haematococcus lacustris]
MNYLRKALCTCNALAGKEADVESRAERTQSWALTGLKGLKGFGSSLLRRQNGALSQKDFSGLASPRAVRNNVLHIAAGGLMGPHALVPGEAGVFLHVAECVTVSCGVRHLSLFHAENIVTAVKTLRRASMMTHPNVGGNNAPDLAAKAGSLVSYFYAPHPTPGAGIAVSPDGAFMVRFGYGPDMRLLRSSTGSVAATLSHSVGHVRFATFSADGDHVIAATDDCRLLIWSVHQPGCSVDPVDSVDLAPLSMCIGVWQSEPDVSLAWAVSPGGPSLEDQVHPAGQVPVRLTLQPAARIAASQSGSVGCVSLTLVPALAVQSLAGGGGAKPLVANIDVGLEPLAYCLLAPNKQTVLSCDDDGQLELWSVQQGTMIRRFDIPFSAKRARFSPDGTKVIACSDFDIQVALCNVDTGEVAHSETFDDLSECRNKANYCISEDGSKVLVYVTDHCYAFNVALFDTLTLSYQKLLVSGGSLVHALISDDGADFVATGRDDKIHVYDTATATLLVTLAGHRSDVLYCQVTADRRHAISGDNSGHVLLWAVDSGDCILRMQAHQAPVLWCSITKDCSRAVTLDNEGHAYLWFLDTQMVFDVLRQQSDQLCCLALVPGGQGLVVGYADGLVKCWTSCRGALSVPWSYSQHQGQAIEAITVAPNAQLMASASPSGRIVVAQVGSGAVLAELAEHSDRVTSLTFSTDSSVLASAAQDGGLVVWATGRRVSQAPLLKLKVPGKAEVKQCAVSGSGSIVAAVCTNGCVYAYFLPSSLLLFSLATEVPLRTATFSNCGKLIAIGAADGNVRVYDANTGSLKHCLVGNASALNALFFLEDSQGQASVPSLTSVCSRQAVTWDVARACKSKVADFVADLNGLFHNSTMSNRVFVNHHGLSLFDPLLEAALYDMREYEKHPGDSFMFRDGTVHVTGGLNAQPMVLYTPPCTTVHMLVGENGGARSLDFSADGHLLISGNLRGELTVFNVEHHCQLHKWTAHKRSAITCVKFTHDSSAVYSCGGDCKVILWDWRTQTQLSLLTGHQAPVMSVDMSLNGNIMVSGDKDGMLIVWDAVVLVPQQIVAAHEGPVLCCSVSPDGSKIASSGTDEHIVILDSQSGQELFSLDDAMDGKGMTIKFSFEGSRIEIGGEKGSVLIWDVLNNCLLYDIKAHDGKVFDCSWSGDSRRLLSVGSDGKARLWDSAAGSELCAANFHRGFGVVEAGGFIKCDLSVDGSTMAGCTAKGQLVLWYVGAELRKGPDGSMLYEWLASMPLSRARAVYTQLLEHHPLAINTQDSRGWTVLMHAAHDSNPEITKLIIANLSPQSGVLGLTASLPCPSPGIVLGSAASTPSDCLPPLAQRLAQEQAGSGSPLHTSSTRHTQVTPLQQPLSRPSLPGLAGRKPSLVKSGAGAGARPVLESSQEGSSHGKPRSSPTLPTSPPSVKLPLTHTHRVKLQGPEEAGLAKEKPHGQPGHLPKLPASALKKSPQPPSPELAAATGQPRDISCPDPASPALMPAGAEGEVGRQGAGAGQGPLMPGAASGPDTGHSLDDEPEPPAAHHVPVSLSGSLHLWWGRLVSARSVTCLISPARL